MRSISRYIWRIISISLLLSLATTSIAKEKGKPEKTLYGVSLELDVLHPMLHLFNSNRMGVNAGLQFDLWHKLIPSVVVGYDWFDASDDYSYPLPAENNLYKVNGLYFKVGAMYNIWRKDYSKDLNPMGYLGINYAFSPGYSFQIENFPINNGYWNNETNSTFQAKGRTFANWGELVGGVKAPIARNFCLGFEVMFKLFLHMKDQEIDNSIIHQSYAPGFGDKESGKWGFRYTISYFFHLNKEKSNGRR